MLGNKDGVPLTGGMLGNKDGVPLTGGMLGNKDGVPLTGGMLGNKDGVPLSGGMLGNKDGGPLSGGMLGNKDGLPSTGGMLGNKDGVPSTGGMPGNKDGVPLSDWRMRNTTTPGSPVVGGVSGNVVVPGASMTGGMEGSKDGVSLANGMLGYKDDVPLVGGMLGNKDNVPSVGGMLGNKDGVPSAAGMQENMTILRPNSNEAMPGNKDSMPVAGTNIGTSFFSHPTTLSVSNDQLPPEAKLLEQTNIPPSLDIKLPSKESWPAQQNIPGNVGTRGWPETLPSGEQKIDLGVDFRGSPEEVRQMLVNRGILQGTNQGQSAGGLNIQNLGKDIGAEAPNVQPHGVEPNEQVKGSPSVLTKPMSSDGSPSGAFGAGKDSDNLSHSLGSTLGHSENSVYPMSIPAVTLQNASSGKVFVDGGLVPDFGGGGLKNGVIPNPFEAGNLNTLDYGMGVKGLTDETKNLYTADKNNLFPSGKISDPDSLRFKSSLENTQQGDVVKVPVGTADNFYEMNPKLASNPGIALNKDGDSQVVDKTGLEKPAQTSMLSSWEEYGQTGLDVSVEVKADPDLY
ncbi:hypothetical protein EGW08_017163 [Elysia chlorotica]|uniref:Uncharacterized protein n=1 Tax=Elysia chlorotica TaxID=188477 RepID=A0A433T0K7_ELYCH|nr:hypothetical protein EGW08_017163 [Elysia chlorotica]